MFVLEEVCIYKVCFYQYFLWCSSFTMLGGFMICGIRNKTAEKRLERAIFKLLVFPYMHTSIYTDGQKKRYICYFKKFM